ncbi:MAG: hypothetical protein SOR75_06700 [Synergistes jonesii]|uniref:hypothetical protein n=1 Tax=Synergistes jonesii TaxID=2754 RepID=UPI002A7546D2|nr:hypothetical protein [Synergistes jonesii]MDY2985007.1 hypothetical protein [Synergistes jonesii]
MKSKKIFRVAAAILACAMIFQSAPAVFAAEGEPEGVAFPQKYTELIMKEHDKYIEAFLNAEMGNRYYFKQIYDAKYRGKKAPSQEELDAMRFELKILNKELSASAKRYARNIGMAKMAMAGMNEEERTLLAKALSHIFARPAYAFDASALDGIEAGLNRIAADTANIGYTNEYEAAVDEAKWAKIGRIATTGTGLLASTVGVVGSACIAIAAAPAAPVAITAGTVVGGTALFIGFVGGWLGVGTSYVAFRDAVFDEETDTSEVQSVASTLTLLSLAGGVPTLKTDTEYLKAAVDAFDAGKDALIGAKDTFFALLDASEDAKAPGRAGVDKVKKAKEAAGAGGSGKGGGGGHG